MLSSTLKNMYHNDPDERDYIAELVVEFGPREATRAVVM